LFTGGGVDYNSGPYIIRFPIGITIIPVDVIITSDDINEGVESFEVAIDSGSLHTWVTLGNFSEANVTITDENCKFH